jgi:hypothetical protein
MEGDIIADSRATSPGIRIHPLLLPFPDVCYHYQYIHCIPSTREDLNKGMELGEGA